MSRVESPELAGAVRRMMRSLVKRAEHGDEAAAAELLRLHRDADAFLHAAVQALNVGEEGQSWAFIARELGVTKQAAWERFGKAKAGGKAKAASGDRKRTGVKGSLTHVQASHVALGVEA
jgi:hypothetical protein